MCVCKHLLAVRSLFVEVMPVRDLIYHSVLEKERSRVGGGVTALSVQCTKPPLAQSV